MLKVEMDGEDVLVVAHYMKFWLSQDEARKFSRGSCIERGAWRNSQDATMYDKTLTIKGEFVLVRHGRTDRSIKLATEEMNLFISSVAGMQPVEITPAANWVTN